MIPEFRPGDEVIGWPDDGGWVRGTVCGLHPTPSARGGIWVVNAPALGGALLFAATALHHAQPHLNRPACQLAPQLGLA